MPSFIMLVPFIGPIVLIGIGYAMTDEARTKAGEILGFTLGLLGIIALGWVGYLLCVDIFAQAS